MIFFYFVYFLIKLSYFFDLLFVLETYSQESKWRRGTERNRKRNNTTTSGRKL